MPVLVVEGVRINVDEDRSEGSVYDLVVDGQRVRVELVEELSRDPMTLLLRIERELSRSPFSILWRVGPWSG